VEVRSHADWPDDGGDIEREHALDFVKKLEWLASFPVHFVDEGGNRNLAEAANLNSLRVWLSIPFAASITTIAESTAVSGR